MDELTDEQQRHLDNAMKLVQAQYAGAVDLARKLGATAEPDSPAADALLQALATNYAAEVFRGALVEMRIALARLAPAAS